MDDSDLLAFTPVPLRSRRDGWTAKRQYFFILGLARGFGVGTAATILGMSRQEAYALRRRPGAQGFAAAWDAAVARARARRCEARRPSLAERAHHGEWHPRLYRGRLVGWTHRPASARAMGLLRRLDARAARIASGVQSSDFHDLLAALGSEADSLAVIQRIERRNCRVSPAAPPLGKARG